VTVEIPDGWIPVCSYDKRTDKSNGGARGEYALLLKAADLDAVGLYEVVLNKNPLSAA
jgi:hypothetical protein